MKWIRSLLFMAAITTSGIAQSTLTSIPEALKDWENWALWPNLDRDCPSVFNDQNSRICFWPVRLNVETQDEGGTWTLDVTAFSETWIPLPGNQDHWPRDVRLGEEGIAVLERNGRPSIQVPKGSHSVTGKFIWSSLPEKIAVPAEIGVVSLKVRNQAIPLPIWDSSGDLWFQRDQQSETAKEQLEVQIYRILEDGIPLWLHTDIQLSVSGKSREEFLGWSLPEGWVLSSVESQIPVAIDDLGKMKAQVRAGQWTIQLHAFRTTDAKQIGFASDAQPTLNRELIGFRARPDYRVAEIKGLAPVDVTQTTFPEEWRGLPVYQWDTSVPFGLEEKMRGMGDRKPTGLQISRRCWLDEDGRGMTFRDDIAGSMQEISRLDVADGQKLGAVQINGLGQLITAHPQNQSPGVEIRTRNLNLKATGRTENVTRFSANGWKADADALHVTMLLPPGWRMLALFGADRVEGDWITAWTLLDLFFLLIFSIAVYRMWGILPGAIAFIAIAFSFHEFGAPRIAWIFLLIPVGLLRVVTPGVMENWLRRWRMIALIALLLILVPFVANQVQSLLYPQLEYSGVAYDTRLRWNPLGIFVSPLSSRSSLRSKGQLALDQPVPMSADNSAMAPQSPGVPTSTMEQKANKALYQESNLQNSLDARIQTGPAEPEWEWGVVQCLWNGPVSTSQTIRPILISLSTHRLITVTRLITLVMLAWILVRKWERGNRWYSVRTMTKATLVWALLQVYAQSASAQFPPSETIEGLRQRLLEASDAFPNAAEIAETRLSLRGNRITLDSEVHSAVEVAVPLPGRMSDWTPISVSVDGRTASAICRRDDYLWVVVPKGVHKIVVDGLLEETSEWQCSFLLKPRFFYFEPEEGWEAKGISPNGVPNDQVILRRLQPAVANDANYDRREFQPVIALDRTLEIGLLWRVHNRVTRLSNSAKAVSLKIPLLTGERVVTGNVSTEGGTIEISLPEGQSEVVWESELPITPNLELGTNTSDRWVERWYAVTSPVWNVSYNGLAPILEANVTEWIPTWRPWPGEHVTLSFSRPVAIPGETVTVQRVLHETQLGIRQQASRLHLQIETSLGGDFILDIDPKAKISSLQRDQVALPVRRDASKLIIPTQPGKQLIAVEWRTDEALPVDFHGEAIGLPIEWANVTSLCLVPESRWVLWTDGPLRGPAVRFWVILLCAILAALALGRISHSPLMMWEWILLGIGLTQVSVAAALLVVAWFFIFARRGKQDPELLTRWKFNSMQVLLAAWTALMLLVLVIAVGRGLLGSPRMFILGNGSSQTYLSWFQPRGSMQLPIPRIISVSVWYYRLAMLFWALWLASALLRWLKWGWQQFGHHGYWRAKA